MAAPWAAGVAAGEAGQAAKAIEHYSTAVSQGALPLKRGTLFNARTMPPWRTHASCMRHSCPSRCWPAAAQVKLMPRYAEAWCNMGVLHKQQARSFAGLVPSEGHGRE